MKSETQLPGGLALRPMTAIDVPGCQALSAELGWPHRLEDWAQMFRLARGAVIETSAGEIVATGFVALQGSCATIGLLITKEAYQGRGLGRRLMEWAIDQADGRPILLNATKAGLALYEKLGFRAIGSVRQYQGPMTEMEAAPAEHSVRPATSADAERILALSSEATGFDRRAIVSDVLTFSRRICVLEASGQIEAFGCIRPFGRGLHIGPLVAADVEQAAAILHQLSSGLSGEFVRMDCPIDDRLDHLLQQSGLARASEVVQMVRGTPPAAGVRQFGLLTQALG